MAKGGKSASRSQATSSGPTTSKTSKAATDVHAPSPPAMQQSVQIPPTADDYRTMLQSMSRDEKRLLHLSQNMLVLIGVLYYAFHRYTHVNIYSVLVSVVAGC